MNQNIQQKMIYILTNYKYPAGDAGSLRMHSLAKAFRELGHETKIICHGPITDGGAVNDGVKYRSLRLPNKYLSYGTMPVRMMWELYRCVKREKVTHVIAACVSAPTLIMLKFFCRLHGVKLVYDVVEWYAASQFKNGKRNLNYFWNNTVNTKIIDHNVRVISISTYLDNYYRSKGIASVRVPIFFQQKDVFELPVKEERITITYAGQPGKKDYVWLMIKGLATLAPDLRSKLKFNIIGCSLAQVQAICDNCGVDYASIEDSLAVHGRIPNTDVLKWLDRSHFTFLLRDGNERYAKAGFPSKVIESISHGVPPIMNLTSDLGLYFENGKTCIEVADLSLESIHSALESAVNITKESYAEMARNSAVLAREEFNVDSYLDELAQILL